MATLDETSRVIGNLERGMEAMNHNLEEIKNTLKTMDQRLSHIEEKEQRRSGAIAVLSIAGGGLGAIIWKLGSMLFTIGLR